jgi:hypothetical protein
VIFENQYLGVPRNIKLPTMLEMMLNESDNICSLRIKLKFNKYLRRPHTVI